MQTLIPEPQFHRAFPVNGEGGSPETRGASGPAPRGGGASRPGG